MLFSQRQGLTPVIKAIQHQEVDEDLRNGLWNILDLCVWSYAEYSHYNAVKQWMFYPLIWNYWHSLFKSPVDRIPRSVEECIKSIRCFFFECKWYEVFDFLEFTLEQINTDHKTEHIVSRLIAPFNSVLEREQSAYRLVQNKFVEITSSCEIDTIDTAIREGDRFPGAKAHLEAALGHLSDRDNPDYRNSIKESLSAIESLARTITGDSKSTLGQALKVLRDKHDLHPALEAAFSKLYGYASDSGGIRHAMGEMSTVNSADAKFFLVACSAFVNLLTEKLKDNG